LKENHPELFERALAIERQADLKKIMGLGCSFSWSRYADDADKEDLDKFVVIPDQNYGCYDG
jgi:hypothetical protein